MKGNTLRMRMFTAHHEITTSHFSKTNRLVLGSLLGAVAAIFQSAGLIAGIGYLFSMLATGPIIMATILSVRIGVLTYILTTLLLVIIQPTEVIVFLFTTGLLGVSLGIGFKVLKQKTLVTIAGGVSLAVGIMMLLYLFQFPILGPQVTSDASVTVILGILSFCLLYSWLWMRVSIIAMKQMNRKQRDGSCASEG